MNLSVPLIDDDFALRYDMVRKGNRLQRKSWRPSRTKRELRVPNQKIAQVQRLLVRQASLKETCL